MYYKANTQKQQAYDFYNSYEWKKVSRPTFYQRVRLGWTETREEKIRLRVPNQYRRREYVPKGKWADEIIWYNEQPEPKASKTLFRNRLNGGYPKEEAILIGEKRMLARERRKPKTHLPPKPYVPQRTVQKAPDEDDFLIKVSLSPEEARVFRREYQKMIEELEWELTYTSEKTEVKEMNSKLERLQNELVTFNSYNPK